MNDRMADRMIPLNANGYSGTLTRRAAGGMIPPTTLTGTRVLSLGQRRAGGMIPLNAYGYSGTLTWRAGGRAGRISSRISGPSRSARCALQHTPSRAVYARQPQRAPTARAKARHAMPASTEHLDPARSAFRPPARAREMRPVRSGMAGGREEEEEAPPRAKVRSRARLP